MTASLEDTAAGTPADAAAEAAVDGQVPEAAPPTASAPRTRRRRWRFPGWGRLSIQSKLLLMLLVVSVLSALIVGIIGYRSGRDALRDSAFARLTNVRESRTREINRLFGSLQNELVINTQGRTAVEGLRDFGAGFEQLENSTLTPAQDAAVDSYYRDVFVPNLSQRTGNEFDADGFIPTDPAQRYLQALYTASGSGEADEIEDAGDGSAWSAAHAIYHGYFDELTHLFGYADVLLIDTSGNVVYSTEKGVDLGTNLNTGPYRDSALGRAYDNALRSNSVDFTEITDFDRYQPALNVPSAWAVSPVGENGQIAGVLALRIPIDVINEVMTGGQDWSADGLGETGETYLAGRDGLMRSVSRELIENPEEFREDVIGAGTPPDTADRMVAVKGTILLQPINTEAANRARQGETGEIVARDYLGKETLTAYAPVDLAGLDWVIVAKIDSTEAFEPASDFARKIGLSTAAIILAVCLASLLLAQVFVRPLRRLLTGVRRVAAGDLDVQVDGRSQDEFGDLATAFNDMSRSLRIKADLLEQQQQEHQRLLLTLMPENVARRYREGEQTIAEDHQNVSVVFADVVGFEAFSADLPSAESLTLFNGLMRTFDEAAARAGVEKVRTLHEGYLASSGLVVPRVDSVRRAVEFARELQQVVQRFNAQHGSSLAVRAGVDAGTVTSGLIGPSSVVYDMWGDAVNLAYRVQAISGEAGIYVTSGVYEKLRDSMEFEAAGELDTTEGREQVWRLRVSP